MKKAEKWGWGGGGQGGQIIFPKNGWSVDAIDDSLRKCRSRLRVIILGGVEIKMVDFGGSVVQVYEHWLWQLEMPSLNL